MLLKIGGVMTAEELSAASKNRFFDQITVVTGDLCTAVKNLTDLYGLKEWSFETRTEKSNPGIKRLQDNVLSDVMFLENIASTNMGNVQLCLVQPKQGETVHAKYYGRYGSGICCVRENIDPDLWLSTLDYFKELGIKVVQIERAKEGEAVWLDTLEQFGGMLALHTDFNMDRTKAKENKNTRRLTQINLVTDDVDRTVAHLTKLLRIGPWSIGTLNNQTVSEAGLLVNGRMIAPEFQFQLGITFVGNIEFEVIQPVKGPTVYDEFLQRHGCGYHHIKEVVGPEKWQETLDGYAASNIQLSIKGQVGPTHFAYLASEEKFGFVVELGDGLAADPLPEGYNEYHYPAG